MYVSICMHRTGTLDRKYSKALIYEAKYQRNSLHGKHTRFGDIIPLARGRMEENGSQFILVESDYQGCMHKRNCKLTDEIPANVSALWMVEMIRHRNPTRGHANELKLTVFPIKRGKSTDNNNKREAKRDQHPLPRSFVIRDKDYPFYFVDTMLPVFTDATPSEIQIQKRTFDMLASVTQNTFDDYHLPLHFNYKHNEQLNTGEYFAGGAADIAPTASSYANYGNSITATPYHDHHLLQAGHHIRFPTADGITGPDFLDRVSSTPLTATHLHHHFYLNRNHIGANVIGKDNINDKHAAHAVSDAYSLGNLQHLHENSGHLGANRFELQNNNFHSLGQHNFPAEVRFPTAAGTAQSFQEHQTQFTPSSHNGEHQQHGSINYVPPIAYQFSAPLQIPSPLQPHLPSVGYYNEHEIPLPTAGGQFYAPYHTYPAEHIDSRLNHHQPIVPHLSASPSPPFQANYQLENNQFSEPDPIYHQQISVLQHHLQPHLLAHQYPSGYALGIQHHHQQPINVNQINEHGPQIHTPGTLDVIPLNNQGIPIKPSSKPPSVLVTGTGGYDIPTEKLHLEPDHNNGSKYDQLPAPSGAEFTSDGGDPSPALGYPDSINAQLPPPNQNDDLNIPYVDSSVVASQTSAELVDRPKSTLKIRQKQRNPDAPRKRKPTTTETISDVTSTQTSIQASLTSEQIKRLRNRGGYFQPKTSTEKAILKWMPKRNKPRIQDDLNAVSREPEAIEHPTPSLLPTISTTSESDTTTLSATTPKVFIVTPTQLADNDDEPMTSISTSISYKVGDEEHRTVTSVLANDVAQQLYNGFEPTIIPGVAGVIDVAPGKVAAINTNTSKLTLFRASDERDDRPTSGTTVEEDQIARTILRHAAGLN